MFVKKYLVFGGAGAPLLPLDPPLPITQMRPPPTEFECEGSLDIVVIRATNDSQHKDVCW